MEYFVLLTLLVFASKYESVEGFKEDPHVVKIEEDEYFNKRSSDFIGVHYKDSRSKWEAKRWSKIVKK
jgi:hypothetical protein